MIPSERLGVNTLLARIGEGQSSEVYLARVNTVVPDWSPLVAVKIPRRDVAVAGQQHDAWLARQRRSMQLDHRNTPLIYEVDHGSEGTPFCIEQLVFGLPLSRIVARSGTPLPSDVATAIAGSLAAALSYAHRKGVRHGAITAARVLMHGDGTAQLRGFGRDTRSALTDDTNAAANLIGELCETADTALQQRVERLRACSTPGALAQLDDAFMSPSSLSACQRWLARAMPEQWVREALHLDELEVAG
ncbi:MAG: protein kinase [Myxococcales bacterium]|nr:protein kinase [Myxococcales bacterium]